MFEFPPARTEPKTTTNSPAGFSLAGVIFISGHGVSTILGYRVKSKWARGSRERGFSIMYNGKYIRKFYVEGMDLMGGGYGVITNNLDADKIARVEVYRNHQPIKALKTQIQKARPPSTSS